MPPRLQPRRRLRLPCATRLVGMGWRSGCRAADVVRSAAVVCRQGLSPPLSVSLHPWARVQIPQRLPLPPLPFRAKHLGCRC
eukprot:14146490-Alexandrium_andersonii.AAC.1